MTLDETWLDVPVTGVWTIHGFPEVIEVDGRPFHKARMKDTYPGVVEQYREAVPRNSRHLKVRADGTWIIDHVDHFNPDMGKPVEHFFVDHPVGQLLLGAGVGLAAGLIVVGIAHAASGGTTLARKLPRR